MRIIKRLLCLTALAVAFSAGAEGNNIWLHLKSGEKVIFNFDNHPIMSFDHNNIMTVKDAKKSVTTKAFSLLHKMTFVDASGINDAIVDKDGKIMHVTPADLTLVGFKAGTQVTVTTAAGVTLLSKTIEDESPVDISLGGYAPGVYIVVAGNMSYKIAIK